MVAGVSRTMISKKDTVRFDGRPLFDDEISMRSHFWASGFLSDVLLTPTAQRLLRNSCLILFCGCQ